MHQLFFFPIPAKYFKNISGHVSYGVIYNILIVNHPVEITDIHKTIHGSNSCSDQLTSEMVKAKNLPKGYRKRKVLTSMLAECFQSALRAYQTKNPAWYYQEGAHTRKKRWNLRYSPERPTADNIFWWGGISSSKNDQSLKQTNTHGQIKS